MIVHLSDPDQTSVSVLLVMGELISWGIRQMLQKLNQIQ